MRDKVYSDCNDDYDYNMDPFWVHSTVAAAPETYAIRCYRGDDDKPALDERLVLFWALVEWKASNRSNMTVQRFIPVISYGGGGRTADVWIQGPIPDEDILGYASRQQLEEKDGANSRDSWLRVAEDHLKQTEKEDEMRRKRNEEYMKQRNEEYEKQLKASEDPSLS